MNLLPQSVRNYLQPCSRKPSSRQPRPKLQLERLEDRLVPAVDYSALPLMLGGYPHSGPTNLALNFTGGAYQNSYQVQSWSTARQNYDDLLFRVSELFAPFNVQVYNQPGFGTFTPGSGSTTVFVGPSVGQQNTGPGVTPNVYVDNPTAANSDHRPDSDPLHGAFVDPTQAQNNGNLAKTALSIAHEAGHTFGLAHVRTDGLTDNGGRNALGTGTVPDIMNYNTNMQGGIYFQQYFSFQSLNLTDFNYNAQTNQTTYQPAGHPYWDGQINGQRYIVNPDTQSSFFYLKYVLGDRPDRRYHVADQSVDPTMDSIYHYQPTADTLGQGLVESRQRSIDRLGDYEVERWTASRTQTIELDVTAANQSTGLKPMLLVHDSNGNLVGSAYPGQINGGTIKFNFAVQAGKTYYFIVGSGVTQNTGNYTFRLVQETHTFYVAINSLVDHIPDPDPKNLARYTTEARVEIGNQDGFSWLQGTNGLYSQTLPVIGNSGQVQMRIDVFRHYQPAVLHQAGKIAHENGQWVVHYKDGTTGAITDVNGTWVVHYPDGTSHDTGIPTDQYEPDSVWIPPTLWSEVSGPAAGVKTGTVRSINLTYDLATQRIVGMVDAYQPLSGLPMQRITVPGSSSLPDLTFTVAMDQVPPVLDLRWIDWSLYLNLLNNGAGGKGVGVLPVQGLTSAAAGSPTGGPGLPTQVVDMLFAKQSSSTSTTTVSLPPLSGSGLPAGQTTSQKSLSVATIPLTTSAGSTALAKKSSVQPADALFGPWLS